MKYQILFVDDEPRILDGLRRALHVLRPSSDEWRMDFVSSGEEALQYLAACPVDVVVSDMRMDDMDGCQLLERVRRQSPTTVRIVFSGHSDRDDVMRSVSVAQQFLTKPCEPEAILATVMRACRTRDRLDAPRHREMVSRIASLPSGGAHAELIAELESADPCCARVGEIISRDVAMTAKVLQLVSSRFFGSPRAVSHPAHWAALLGVDTFGPLVRERRLFHTVATAPGSACSIDVLSAHSQRVARFAQAVTASETDSATSCGQAYVAGLLHDVGLFVLAEHAAERLAEVWAASRDAKISVWDVEQAAVGVTHAEIGGYLLALWGAADVLVESTTFHHAPAKAGQTGFGVLTAVHVANAVADADDLDIPVDGRVVDFDYLRQIGCADRLAVWCDVCRQADAPATCG